LILWLGNVAFSVPTFETGKRRSGVIDITTSREVLRPNRCFLLQTLSSFVLSRFQTIY
jgi:hypothetical protein